MSKTAKFVWLLCIVAVAGVATAQENGASQGSAVSSLPSVLAVRVTSTPERARLIMDLSAETQFAFVSLSGPNRIAVDVRAEKFVGSDGGIASGTGLISNYKMEQIGADRVRTYLSLGGGAQVQQAYVLAAFEGQPTRLVVDIIGTSDDLFLLKVAEDAQASSAIAQNAANAADTLTQISDAPGASQIEAVSRPLILIDPGHGGIDGGAETAEGVREKEITLLFARQLQEVLIASGRYDVALTRESDVAFWLEQRVQLARDNKADLFISIHADSFDDPSIRGASVYIRDEEATDVLDKVLAENENKADLLSGFIPDAEEPAVVNILVELMRREMRRQSFIAARAIVDQLKPSIRVRRFPLRRADFFVLQSPDVPAVLLELGFLSNSSDSENLVSPAWRQRVAEAVARGITSFFDGNR
ncbi:MAG: N-acetylmuramoyl-L-alanine amidase [Devosiaceae bacterium]|nr:N-acetylmuramoyl-L-alanine amidase [Devosiaceae bacterium]